MPLVKRKVVEHVPPPDPRDLANAALARESTAEQDDEVTNTSTAGTSSAAVVAPEGSSNTGDTSSSKAGATSRRFRGPTFTAADGKEYPDPDVFYLEKTGEIFTEYE